MSTRPATLSDLYPFQPYTHVTKRGAKMSYLDEGPRSDEAVVCVHGNPTWSFYYRQVVQALSPNQRVIVPDHIGMGLSEKPQDYPYTLATRIDDLTSLLEHTGVKKVHLVVHDWGGAIGLGWAGRNAEKVGRIVILNTAAFFLDSIPARIALCRAPYLGAWIVRGCNGFAGPATWMSVQGRRLNEAEKQGYLFPYGSWADRVAVHQFVRDIPMEAEHPTRPVLAEVEKNLARLAEHEKLILWGGRDFCFHDGFLARWKEIFPQAAAHRYAEAGHYVLEDTGGDAVRRIAQFLSRKT